MSAQAAHGAEDQLPIFQTARFKIESTEHLSYVQQRGAREITAAAPWARRASFCHHLSYFLYSFSRIDSSAPSSQSAGSREAVFALEARLRNAARRGLAAPVPILRAASKALSESAVKGDRQRGLSTGGSTDSPKQRALLWGLSALFLTLGTRNNDFLSKPTKADL